MYLGTRSARAAAPDLEAAEAELAAAARADGVVATEPRRALGRRRALDAGRRRRSRCGRFVDMAANQKPNSQSNFCFPCYECVLLPETLVLLVSVTLARFGDLGCNIQAL